VDGVPWNAIFGDAVLAPVFSADSRRIAAVVKENNKWTIAVDGEPWSEEFDMIWDPVFSPDGRFVAAKASRGKDFFLVINGKVVSLGCENASVPVFSANGAKILYNSFELGRCYRRVVPVEKFLR